MRITLAGRAGLLLLVFLLRSLVLFAGTPEQIASKTGLDQDLFATITVDVGDTQLAVLAVAIIDRAFSSRISGHLREQLLPYVGKNALYINPTVNEVVNSFPFFPQRLTISQEGVPTFTPTAGDWVEISDGFLNGRFVPNPGGTSYGSGSEGILVMDKAIDITKPFTVSYEGQTANFNVGEGATTAYSTASPTGAAAAPSHAEINVPLPEKITDVQGALTTGEFTRASVAALLSIPIQLVQTITVAARGNELRLVLVYLQDEVCEAAFGRELAASLEPLIGTGAVMVWALSSTGSPFSPWSFFIQQNGTNYLFFSGSSFVELTQGFLRDDEVAAGQIMAGVIRLPKGVDQNAPFSLYYSTNSVEFNAK
jgi:hypothetical protein